MASRIPVRVQRDSRRFSSVLSSAVLEWFLMLLLFLHALYSYLLTKFARFCKLQTPCLLCSRLDHILGNEKPGFYRDLICEAHKSEISSLAYCHVHRKLADVHEMCEGCLLSFATEKKSNPETYRSLVGKLGMNLEEGEDVHLKFPATIGGGGLQNKFYGEEVVEVPLLKEDHAHGSKTVKHCSCCKELFRNKLHALLNKTVGADVAELDISLSDSPGRRHLPHGDRLSKRWEKSLASPVVHRSGNHGYDCLSHVGYSELKITSDSESEVPFSDEEDGNALVRGMEDTKEEFMARCLQPQPVSSISNSLPKIISDDTALEKLIHPTPIIPEPLLLVPERQLHVGESHDISSLASMDAIGHGLEELTWSQVEAASPLPATFQILSQEVPTEVSNTKEVPEIGDIACISTTTSGEVSKALSSTETNVKTSQIINEPTPAMHIHMDLNDAYKLAVGNKTNLPSPTFTEILTGRDSSRIHEDLKLLLSQISAARGLEFPYNDLSPSPRVHGQGDDFKFPDASTSTGLQNLTKRFSIERNESGLESLDGSIVSEIEGESPVGRLKRQVELDRKAMSILFKDLEEERNASAIAANQAMAMITRLQEEKAAMQMEALQYQRMMDEQAEYDQEALQKSNELLTEREKEIQDLEAEVERYRKRFQDGLVELKVLEPLGDTEMRENNPTRKPLDKKSCNGNRSDPADLMPLDSGLSGLLKYPLLDFEDEKEYISECLKKLEKKLHLFSNNGVYVEDPGLDEKEDGFSNRMPDDIIHGACYKQGGTLFENNVTRNGQYSQQASGANNLENSHCIEKIQDNSEMGGHVLSEKRDSSVREDSHVEASSVHSTTCDVFTIEGNHKENLLYSNSDDDSKYSSMVSKKSDLVALGNEVSLLNERLEALEADRNFLEHTINSLRNGNDGVRFIQEIACHLRELRRIGITRREHTAA